MSSSRPYMIRAIYEWILDNSCTPYLLVNARSEGVVVPQAYVQDGQIVLNVSETAVVDLQIDSGFVSFGGRFGGVAQDVWVPIDAVLAIYARENGQGMMFEAEDSPPPGGDDGGSTESNDASEPKRPSLKVVK
ncbi:ClpXP protease specificity-enhancing factor [Litorivivens sp.]|uniref:ClpXP protease specificity-enhancing factor n=2 Tax=Litorivivens sp. TaxID=2020868 RepID=UPI003566A7C2